MAEFLLEFRLKIIDFGVFFDAIISGVSFSRARVSTRVSYAPLRPLVVTASASALRDMHFGEELQKTEEKKQ